MDDSLTLNILPMGWWQVEPIQGWCRERIEVRGKRSDYCSSSWPEDADYLEVRAREFNPDHGIRARYSADRYAIPVPGDAGDKCRCDSGPLSNGLGLAGAFLGDYFSALTPTQKLCVLMYSNPFTLRSITRVAYILVGRRGPPMVIDFNAYDHLTERHDMRRVPPNLDFIAWWDPCREAEEECMHYDEMFNPGAVDDVADLVEWASNARQQIFGGKRPPE